MKKVRLYLVWTYRILLSIVILHGLIVLLGIIAKTVWNLFMWGFNLW